jgi:glucose dehydrogenase
MAAPAWAAGPSQTELDQSATATNSWLMTNKSYDGHRYVELNQINAKNAAKLKEICTFDSGVESSPVHSSSL